MEARANRGEDRYAFAADGRSRIFFLGILLVILTVTATLALMIGRYQVPVASVFQSVVSHLGLCQPPAANFDIIVWEVRMPRILVAGCTGAALAVAGCAFQALFRNPLVEPYILGVSSGAAFGAALCIVLGLSLFSLQLMAVVFALLATFITYRVATIQRDTHLVNLLLAGLVIGSVFIAGLSYLKSIALPGQLQELTFWLMGGFYTAKWSDAVFLVPAVLILVAMLLLFAKKLNVFALGEETAKTMGINPSTIKIAIIFLATCLTAFCVAIVGIIAWVGLLMPHLVRMAIGPDNRYLIPCAAILGAAFMIACDTVARTLTAGEIPITILTSLIGAPILIIMIRRNRKYDFG